MREHRSCWASEGYNTGVKLKKILVLGGSYFLGRVYTMLASEENELTLFNRGNFKVNIEGVTEICGDRKRTEDLKRIPEAHYDAVVDFCAYEEGDIELGLSGAKFSADQYIYISTVDVCAPVPYEPGLMKTEDFRTGLPSGDDAQSRYVRNKLLLEREIRRVATEKNIGYTILRPAVLYGPFNYAPREPELIKQMVRSRALFLPENSSRLYSFCYVKDAALITLALTANEQAYGQSYNLAGPAANAEDVATALMAACAVPVKRYHFSEELLEKRGIPVVFAGTLEESQVYDGTKASRAASVEYISLAEGMTRTYRAFENIYAE